MSQEFKTNGLINTTVSVGTGEQVHLKSKQRNRSTHSAAMSYTFPPSTGQPRKLHSCHRKVGRLNLLVCGPEASAVSGKPAGVAGEGWVSIR